jgi:flagellar L-ring protein FlgH
MKARQYLMLVVAMAALSACSHIPEDVNLSEDELSPPMGEQAEYAKSPGSLWTPSAKFYDMYSDRKARQVGDLIVIQISESSSADKQAKTDASHDSTINNSVTNFLGLPVNQSSYAGKHLEPTIATDSSSKFTGTGETSRSGTLSAVVSARITRILPSGNFIIKGKKQIRVNDESQYIVVSGIVRPDDILGDNSVISANIADLKIDYYGAGILGDQQNKGFIARAIDKIWPF